MCEYPPNMVSSAEHAACTITEQPFIGVVLCSVSLIPRLSRGKPGNEATVQSLQVSSRDTRKATVKDNNEMLGGFHSRCILGRSRECILPWH